MDMMKSLTWMAHVPNVQHARFPQQMQEHVSGQQLDASIIRFLAQVVNARPALLIKLR